MAESSSELKQRLAQRFTEDAEAYRALWAPVLRAQALVLLDGLRIETARRILDLGTGVGMLLPDIRERAPNAFVVGVDLSEGMLSQRPWRTTVVAMDATRLAFEHEMFDVVVSAFVLQFLPEPADGLWEAWRVLRTGGRIGVTTWGNDPGCPAFDIWTEELDALGAEKAEPIIANHDLVDTPEKVGNLLEAAGFASIRTWTGRLDNRLDVEAFLALRTGRSLSKRRFESLGPEARADCVESVRDRLLRLDAEDLVERDEVIFATGLRLARHQKADLTT